MNTLRPAIILKKPATLDIYLIRQFFPVFFAALSIYVLLILLTDYSLNLIRFLNNGVGLLSMLKVSFYYIPKSISYALPISLLFASAYTLGDLGAKNELYIILGSGVPYWRFCTSLIMLGIAFSIFAFFFEDLAVIPSLKTKNRISRELLGTYSENASRIIIKLEGGRLLYSIDFFDSSSLSLNNVTIIQLDENGKLNTLVHAPRAEWNERSWLYLNPVLYNWEKGLFRPSTADPIKIASHLSEQYREEPETFRRSAISASDLKIREAAIHIKDLRRAGLPTASALTEFHRRFSFSAVSFVVFFLSITVSGRFKKNILLLSLIASLGTAVTYYVIEMLSIMIAQIGIISPVLGAWIPVFVCTAAGFCMLQNSKT